MCLDRSVVQGTASDVIKLSMIYTDSQLRAATATLATGHASTSAPASASASATGVGTGLGVGVGVGVGTGTLEEVPMMPRPHLVLSIHDELIYQVAADLRTEAGRRVVEGVCAHLRVGMEKRVGEAFHLLVPLKINITAGTTWGNLAKIPSFPAEASSAPPSSSSSSSSSHRGRFFDQDDDDDDYDGGGKGGFAKMIRG